MEIVRAITYQNWSISLHCSKLYVARFSSVGLVRELYPNNVKTLKRTIVANTMVALTGRFFSTADVANDAVLAAAKRFIDHCISEQPKLRSYGAPLPRW